MKWLRKLEYILNLKKMKVRRIQVDSVSLMYCLKEFQNIKFLH